MPQSSPAFHSKAQSVVMTVPLMAYMFIRLVINMVIQPANLLIIYINYLCCQIEHNITKQSQFWDQETTALLKKSNTKASLAYGLYGLRTFFNICIKTLILVLTIGIFIPFQLITNCTSFLASKFNLPPTIHMNYYLMYLFYGQSDQPISGKGSSFEIETYSKIQKIDYKYTLFLFDFNKQYRAKGIARNLNRANINYITYNIRQSFAKLLSSTFGLIQNISYYLLLPVSVIINTFIIILPYNLLQLIITCNYEHHRDYEYVTTDINYFEIFLHNKFYTYLSIPLFIFGRDALLGTIFYNKEPHSARSKNYYGIIHQSVNILKYAIVSTIEIIIEIILSVPKYAFLSFSYVLNYINEIGLIPMPVLIKEAIKCDHRHLHAKQLQSNSFAFPKKTSMATDDPVATDPNKPNIK